jgi:hypothetical protein
MPTDYMVLVDPTFHELDMAILHWRFEGVTRVRFVPNVTPCSDDTTRVRLGREGDTLEIMVFHPEKR